MKTTNNIIVGNPTGISADAAAILDGGYNCFFDNDADTEGPALAATDFVDDPLCLEANVPLFGTRNLWVGEFLSNGLAAGPQFSR